MRLAAVDIGSNTVHILVADVVRNKLEDVAHYVEMPELGARVARTGSIGTKGRIAIRALKSVVARARKHGYERLIAGATAAVRQASDGEAFAIKAGDAARRVRRPLQHVPVRSAAPRGARPAAKGRPARACARSGRRHRAARRHG